MPTNNSQTQTYKIITKTNSIPGDIDTNENDFDELINTVKKLASKFGSGSIYFHACKETYLHKLFETRFESFPSFPVLFQNFNENIDIKKIKFTSADMDTF